MVDLVPFERPRASASDCVCDMAPKIGDLDSFIPAVSVISVGEGGGSIAWVDSQDVLRSGPESAGSSPGPACSGRGGERATITDAFASASSARQTSAATP